MANSRVAHYESKVYAFSNENLTSFGDIYDFDGATVLTVLGSGDQYFASKLFGAKTVEVYDSNPNTWFHFVLKFYAIKILSYEDFYSLFIESRLTELDILRKIMPYLPHDILVKIQTILKHPIGFNHILLYSPLSDFDENYKTGRIIPYLNREDYYKLQNMLRTTELPKMHTENILDLPLNLNNQSFDILLASNIYKWLIMTPKEYDEFLNKFKVDTIQAYYTWHINSSVEDDFAKNLGYQIDYVEPTVPLNRRDPSLLNEKDTKNLVITKKI